MLLKPPLLLPLLPPLAKSQQVPLELQHLCARYLPTMDQMRIKRNILRMVRLKTKEEQFAAFFGIQRYYPFVSSPVISALAPVAAPATVLSLCHRRHQHHQRRDHHHRHRPHGRNCLWPGRGWVGVYNERVDKTLGFPGREEFARCKQANTPRFQQFCEKKCIVCGIASVRLENTMIISSHSPSTHPKTRFPGFPENANYFELFASLAENAQTMRVTFEIADILSK